MLAGLDPGGGAGLLADARAITAAGAFACGVVTLETVQSTRGLRRAQAVLPRVWLPQAREVLATQRVRAIKVGALGNAANVSAAAALLRSVPHIPSVVDPVLLPTRGRARLLDARALAAMRAELIPAATLVTANAHEATALTGCRVDDVRGARLAAILLVALGATSSLVKGGHLKRGRATDVLCVDDGDFTLAGTVVRMKRAVHGAGCVLASLIAARLALGEDVLTAATWAKRVHARALADAADVGGPLTVLGSVNP